MHARVPVGTRVEETAVRFARIEEAIRRVIPSSEIETMVDNIGLPSSNINLTYNNTGVMGSQDGDFQIALKEGPCADRRLRAQAARGAAAQFPDTTFSFPPADIVSQILNFGSPAPIDVQIRGRDIASNYVYAQQLLNKIRAIPGVADARIQQSNQAPCSRWTSTAPRRSSSASPRATSPTAWWSTSPAAARWRRPTGSTRPTA
jgi:multidrug efflux pump subunit AcrB